MNYYYCCYYYTILVLACYRLPAVGKHLNKRIELNYYINCLVYIVVYILFLLFLSSYLS
jgi:hypothetical protein